MEFRIAALAMVLLTMTAHAASPDAAALPKLRPSQYFSTGYSDRLARDGR